MKKVVIRHGIDRFRLDSYEWDLFLCTCTYTASIISFVERNSLYVGETVFSHWDDSQHHAALLQGSAFQYSCMSWGLTGKLSGLQVEESNHLSKQQKEIISYCTKFTILSSSFSFSTLGLPQALGRRGSLSWLVTAWPIWSEWNAEFSGSLVTVFPDCCFTVS